MSFGSFSFLGGPRYREALFVGGLRYRVAPFLSFLLEALPLNEGAPNRAASRGTIRSDVLGELPKDAGEVTLDDLAPPTATEKAVAARTFASLLTLATAGELTVKQRSPYGKDPIYSGLSEAFYGWVI